VTVIEPSGTHPGRYGLDHAQRAPEPHLQAAPRLIKVHLGKGAAAKGAPVAGGVDEVIEGAGGLRRTGDIRRVADVQHQALGARQPFDRRGDPLGVAGGDNHPGPRPGGQPRHGEADTRRSADNQNPPARDIHASRLPPSRRRGSPAALQPEVVTRLAPARRHSRQVCAVEEFRVRRQRLGGADDAFGVCCHGYHTFVK
jgi:hypothetical protein